MSTDKRFDVEILETAQASADSLLKHKEVRSVAVLIDWNLAPKIAAELPVGALKLNEGQDGIQALTSMLTQHVQSTIALLQRCVEIANTLQEQADKKPKV